MRSMLIPGESRIHRHQEKKKKQNDNVVSGNGGPEADFLGPCTLILIRELQQLLYKDIRKHPSFLKVRTFFCSATWTVPWQRQLA